MANLSIEVTGKIRSGLFLLSALLEQGPKVAQLVMKKFYASPQRGEEPPSFLAQIQTLSQILRNALQLMQKLDGLTVDENNLRAFLFDDREKKIAALAQQVFAVRQIISGYYVEPDLKRLGLEGETRRESVALLRQSEKVCKQLEGDDLEQMLGESRFEPALDPRPLVPQIEPYVEQLRSAFDAHQRSRRRVDNLLAEKKEAIEDYDTAFIRVARQFEDQCRLAGLDDLAEKVRPSLTRRGETAVRPPDDEEPSAGGDGAAGDSGEPISEPASEPIGEPAAEPIGEPASEPAAAD